LHPESTSSYRRVVTDLVGARLRNQHLAVPRPGSAASLVGWMGAVQAQEFGPARWGLAQRLAGAPSAADIEQEVESGAILRTHVMRPTWHFVAARDISWMQALTGGHVQRRMANYHRHFELTPRILTRALAVIERELRDGTHLTRAEIGQALGRAGIPAATMRLAHIVMHAEVAGLICSGPRRERHMTYALIAERALKGREMTRDEALAELTLRFFQSHGPATIPDFVWWSGLPTADAKRGLEMIRGAATVVRGRTYWSAGPPLRSTGPTKPRADRRPHVRLLPIYDEYLVAYRDRDLVPHGPPGITDGRRFAHFQHALIIGGQVAGTWRTSSGSEVLDIVPARRLPAAERDAVSRAEARYRRFLRSSANRSKPRMSKY
jgi:hypothetical protein